MTFSILEYLHQGGQKKRPHRRPCTPARCSRTRAPCWGAEKPSLPCALWRASRPAAFYSFSRIDTCIFPSDHHRLQLRVGCAPDDDIGSSFNELIKARLLPGNPPVAAMSIPSIWSRIKTFRLYRTKSNSPKRFKCALVVVMPLFQILAAGGNTAVNTTSSTNLRAVGRSR